jgi:hypothetical protein
VILSNLSFSLSINNAYYNQLIKFISCHADPVLYSKKFHTYEYRRLMMDYNFKQCQFLTPNNIIIITFYKGFFKESLDSVI